MPTTCVTARSHHQQRPHSANIKGQLKCIFSRSNRPTTPAVGGAKGRGRSRSAGGHHHGTLVSFQSDPMATQREYKSSAAKAKRKRSSTLGHEEEKRIMRILHNLQSVEKKGGELLKKELLTQLYIKPLPLYIQSKLKEEEEEEEEKKTSLLEDLLAHTAKQAAHCQSTSPAVLEDSSPADKIQLPERKPQLTSKWQQKMLAKLEKMDQSSNTPASSSAGSSRPFHQQPHLNRQLQVQGQSSSPNSCKQQTISPNINPTRYKPPLPAPTATPPYLRKQPRQAAFPYTDPLPHPTSYLATKESLTPFEERILELEKMERDSVVMERNRVRIAANKETTTRLPATLTKQSNNPGARAPALATTRANRTNTQLVRGATTKGSNRGSPVPNTFNRLSIERRKMTRELGREKKVNSGRITTSKSLTVSS